MSKQPTLFNFFKKIPSPITNVEKKPLGPVEIIEKGDACATPTGVLSDRKIKANNDDLEICDIVWAKLAGFPWWPALICRDPDNQKFITKTKLHVQFFDSPPSRGWVDRSQGVQAYSVEGGHEYRVPARISDKERPKLEQACKEADKAAKLSRNERDSLVVNFKSPAPGESDLDNDENQDSPGTDKENNGQPPSKRAKKLDFDSEDSEDEYKPAKDEASDDDDDIESGKGSEEEEMDVMVVSEEEELLEESKEIGNKRKRKPESAKTPRSKSRKQTAASTPRHSSGSPSSPRTASTPRPASQTTVQKLAAFKAEHTPSRASSTACEGNWPHLKLPFLQPDKIMDKNRRRPDHPEYDRRTLYVPEDFKNQCTPGVRQWWELKSEHFDCVLFFKVGKFYELYHMDAVTGVNELSLSYMRGEFAHSGFPEIAYGRFSTILVSNGYKVARVEQMETPDMMAERCKKTGRSSKFDKVVNREVCQVTTRGTLSYNVMDGEAMDPQANYLLALTEKEGIYGVSFVDASIGTFHLGQFEDDKFLSRLRTLLSHCNPVQIIYEKKEMSDRTMQVLKHAAAAALQEALQSETEFWSASKTLKVLSAREELQDPQGQIDWPATLQRFISPCDALGLTPADDGELALRALGACVGYLKRSFLDTQLLAMKKFQIYNPLDTQNSFGQFLVLDDITIRNLEILKNSRGGQDGTLIGRLDSCKTFSGKRLLRQWLCAPLSNVKAVKARQSAVLELLDKPELTSELRSIFKTIPDLERLLAKIHAQGNAILSKNHPDSRAVFFEEKHYSKRKIRDFLSALTGFEKLNKALSSLKSEELSSENLQKCSQCPDLSAHLQYFKDAFDHDLAKIEGTIVPKSTGVDPEYDAALEQLESLEKERKQYLKIQCMRFGVEVKYFGTDRNRYQLEISEGAAQKTGSDYEFTTQRKGYKRYVTKETKDMLKRQFVAEESKSSALADLRRRIFAQFSQHYADWMEAVSCMSQLDVLMAFAEFATSEAETCLPVFETAASEPFISVQAGRHPCIPVADGFIPNSVYMGSEDWHNLILLTGPNMGGKSTLLRQLGLHVILAHIGCHLPATSARLSPVDRIFTRIGASDDILAGESTFYQELSETGTILHHATSHSIVLVDELGRGTSTYDGTAIAHAVVVALAQRKCRTLFSTHYHSLVEELQATPGVSLGHMSCLAEGDTITFLYQFVRDACPSSHGFHAARLAGLPEDIIQHGKMKAEELDREGQHRQIFRKLFQSQVTIQQVNDLIIAIRHVL